MVRRALVAEAAREFEGADLGDVRRSARLMTIASRLEEQPARGFPRLLGSDAELEAFYRFINNPGVRADDIVAPHIAATSERAAEAGLVVAVHDTTLVEYSSKRKDLGVMTCKARAHGFVAQVALLVSEADGLPLGVASLETLKRSGQKWRKRKKEGQRGHVHRDDKARESLRWLRSVDAVENTRQKRFDVIHVTDAEGDFFELFAHLNASETRFIIRAGQLDRTVRIEQEDRKLRKCSMSYPRKPRVRLRFASAGTLLEVSPERHFAGTPNAKRALLA